jgi:hypothetical protein
MTELTGIAEFVIKNPENLEAMIQIAAAQEDLKSRMLKILSTDLADRCKSRGLFLRQVLTNWSAQSVISMRFSEGDQYGPAFQFGGPNLSGLYFGINKNLESLPDLPEVRKTMDTSFARGTSSAWWVWSRAIKVNDGVCDIPPDWNDSPDLWRSILDHRLPDQIMGCVQKIYDELLSAGQLSLLKG